jgi:hypothetical protein
MPETSPPGLSTWSRMPVTFGSSSAVVRSRASTCTLVAPLTSVKRLANLNMGPITG